MVYRRRYRSGTKRVLRRKKMIYKAKKMMLKKKKYDKGHYATC